MTVTDLHERSGVSRGDFAAFVESCRRDGALSNVSAPGTSRRSFQGIVYRNESLDRALPLYNCEVLESEIIGQFLEMTWMNVALKKVDLSHTRGDAHWTRSVFEGVNFNHLMAVVQARECVFRRCNLKGSVLTDSVFLDCQFERTNLSGAAFVRPTFERCRFDAVDLKRTLWREPLELQITGSWKNATELSDDSDPGAKAHFLAGQRTGVEVR